MVILTTLRLISDTLISRGNVDADNVRRGYTDQVTFVVPPQVIWFEIFVPLSKYSAINTFLFKRRNIYLTLWADLCQQIR